MIAEEAVRGLVAGWLAGPPPVPPARPVLLTGMAVPPAPAAAVIAAARRIVLCDVGGGPRTAPTAELRRLVEVMVLDEHPSVALWSAAERATAADWVALVLHRFGEDGIRRMARVLAGA